MKTKKILGLLLFVFLLNSSNAQLALAKLKFEDAELAYNKGSFEEAISKLADAEKLFGKVNPPILHLRILCLDKLFNTVSPRFGLLDSLRKDALLFLKTYPDVDGLEDKYRQVYRVNEKLNELPNNEIEFEKYIKKIADAKRIEEDAKIPSKVYILRSTGFAASGAGFPIFLNGVYFCKLNTGKYMEAKAMKGKLYLSVQPTGKELKDKTNALEFLIEPASIYYFQVKYNSWNGKTSLEVMSPEEGSKLLKKLDIDTCK